MEYQEIVIYKDSIKRCQLEGQADCKNKQKTFVHIIYSFFIFGQIHIIYSFLSN